MQVYYILFVVGLAFIMSTMAYIEDEHLITESDCNLEGNTNCSTSRYCQCAQTVSGKKICTQQMNCDERGCNTDTDCPKVNSVCVTDSRCPGKKLCHSLVIFSTELCPPLNSESGPDKK